MAQAEVGQRAEAWEEPHSPLGSQVPAPAACRKSKFPKYGLQSA